MRKFSVGQQIRFFGKKATITSMVTTDDWQCLTNYCYNSNGLLCNPSKINLLVK